MTKPVKQKVPKPRSIRLSDEAWEWIKRQAAAEYRSANSWLARHFDQLMGKKP